MNKMLTTYSPLAKVAGFFSWLDARGDVAFLSLLFVARYPIVYPLGLLQVRLANALPYEVDMDLEIGLLAIFLLSFIAAPLCETAMECALPYTAMVGLRTTRPARPWRFIVVSAGLLVAVHLFIYGLTFAFAIPSAFVTGMFFAYCYAHFARRSHARAFAYTSLFHALTNVLPFLLYDLGG